MRGNFFSLFCVLWATKVFAFDASLPDPVIVMPEPQEQTLPVANKGKWKVTTLDQSYVIDDIAFFDKEDVKHYLDEYDGTTVLLSFWASWSDTSNDAIPGLDTLQKDFRKLPFKVVPISIDYQGIEAIEPFYKAYEVRFLPAFYDYKQQLFKAFHVTGVPTSFLINAQNKLLLKFEGNIKWQDEELRRLILEHIPGNPQEPKNSYKTPILDNSVRLPKVKNSDEQTQPIEDNQQTEQPVSTHEQPQENENDNKQ